MIGNGHPFLVGEKQGKRQKWAVDRQKGNYFEERAEKGSFLFNFKVSKDLRKQDGLKTMRISTVKSLLWIAFFVLIDENCVFNQQ